MAYSFKKFVKSFKYALAGFWYVLKNEQNFQIQIAAAIAVYLLAIYFELDLLKIAILTLVIIIVLVLELINTIFERLVDILKPRIHHYAEIIKDIMAAAVLVASIGSIIIALLIFWPYFENFEVF